LFEPVPGVLRRFFRPQIAKQLIARDTPLAGTAEQREPAPLNGELYSGRIRQNEAAKCLEPEN
jgi:hypothetical protein